MSAMLGLCPICGETVECVKNQFDEWEVRCAKGGVFVCEPTRAEAVAAWNALFRMSAVRLQ